MNHVSLSLTRDFDPMTQLSGCRVNFEKLEERVQGIDDDDEAESAMERMQAELVDCVTNAFRDLRRQFVPTGTSPTLSIPVQIHGDDFEDPPVLEITLDAW